MILIILFALITAIGIGILCFYDEDSICGILGVTFGGIPLLIVLTCLIISRINFPSTIAKYETLKVSVENYRPQDYGDQPDLLKEVLDMNYTIAKHKVKSQNLWVNWFYSEEIGNLEPIYIKK